MGPKTSAEQAEAALTAWRQAHDQRDELVRRAHAAGISRNRISTLTGIARTTVYRILDAPEAGNHRGAIGEK